MVTDEDNAVCPACGEAVPRDPAAATLVCPACGETFFNVVDYVEPTDDEDERLAARMKFERQQDALDAVRVKHLVADRQAAWRSRSYRLIVAFACAILAGQAAWQAYREFRGGETIWAAGFAVVALMLVILSVPFFRAARRLRIEAERKIRVEPTETPRFDELSDGSQFARNLDDLQAR